MAAALNNIAQLLNRQQRWDQAIPYARGAVDLQRQTRGETHPLLADRYRDSAGGDTIE